MCFCECSAHEGQKMASDPLKLHLKVVGSSLMWVLRFKLRPSEGAVCTQPRLIHLFTPRNLNFIKHFSNYKVCEPLKGNMTKYDKGKICIWKAKNLRWSKDLNKWRNTLCSHVTRLDIIKLSTLSKLIYTFNTILIECLWFFP